MTDKQQEAQGKSIKFGLAQFNNPTPTIVKNVFRTILYLSAIWAVISQSVTELPAHTLASIDKYLLLANAVINVTIKFFGWDFDNGTASRTRAKFTIIILIVCTSAIANAQNSPFHRLPRPERKPMLGQMAPVPTTITAFRFTGPMAGFMYPQNQVVTGLGYGWQKLHYVDSTLKYYCDFSVSAVIYAGGNVQPSVQDNNIMSIGLSLGFLNQLLMIGPVYNLPKDGNKGKFGVVANFSVPLNN